MKKPLNKYAVYFAMEAKIKAKTGDKGISRQNLVWVFSNGKTTSLKELYNGGQYGLFLTWLQMQFFPNTSALPEGHYERRIIFSLAREIGLIRGYGKGDFEINKITLDSFLLRRGVVKKRLNSLNNKELKRVIAQFQQMKRKNNKLNEKKSKGLVDELCEELNLDREK